MVSRCNDAGSQARSTCCQKADGSFRFQGDVGRGFSTKSCEAAKADFMAKYKAGKFTKKTTGGPYLGEEGLERCLNEGKSLLQCREPSIVEKALGGGGDGGGSDGNSGGDDCDRYGKNEASGCCNCPPNNMGCEIMKLGCEGGHWFQAGGEGALPMIAIAIGAVIVLFVSMK